MKKNKHTQHSPSELRQDIVTGDWVIISTARGKRPDEFRERDEERSSGMMGECPFEDDNPETNGQEQDILVYRTASGEWSLRVFPNKYPAVLRGRVPKSLGEGPYFGMTGTGYHELVVPRDHSKHLALLSEEAIAEIFDAYQDRYLDLMKKKSVRFVSIFHNHGKKAGASLAHPHSQILAIGAVSPYITQELTGAERYFSVNRKCAYCTVAEYEVQEQTRVVAENDLFIAFCPYASRKAFEVWVMPKKHQPYFERITDKEKLPLAHVFLAAMRALNTVLDNPDYNFYLHTAPCDGKDWRRFHWHIEIIPHTSLWAGFELSTGIEISAMLPENAAEYLRQVVSGKQ